MPAQLNPSVGARSVWTPGREQGGSGSVLSRGSPDRQKTDMSAMKPVQTVDENISKHFNKIKSGPHKAEMVEQASWNALAKISYGCTAKHD